MTTAFTWQKAMDFQAGDDGGLARWYINPERNYARADFDRTLNFVQSYVYRLPFGEGQKISRTAWPEPSLADGRLPEF